MLKSDVLVFLQHVDVAILASATLIRHIGETVASTCANTYGVGKSYTSIHEVVQNAACKDATHATTFKYEARLAIEYMLLMAHRCKNYSAKI
jgi:hypothetical protein